MQPLECLIWVLLSNYKWRRCLKLLLCGNMQGTLWKPCPVPPAAISKALLRMFEFSGGLGPVQAIASCMPGHKIESCSEEPAVLACCHLTAMFSNSPCPWHCCRKAVAPISRSELCGWLLRVNSALSSFNAMSHILEGSMNDCKRAPDWNPPAWSPPWPESERCLLLNHFDASKHMPNYCQLYIAWSLKA